MIEERQARHQPRAQHRDLLGGTAYDTVLTFLGDYRKARARTEMNGARDSL